VAVVLTSFPLPLPLFLAGHRELLIMGIRAYLVALLACTMAAPFQGSVKVTSMSWWVMSSIEVLLTPAVGLQLRLGKHLPLQGVMMAALCAACAFSGAIASVPQFIVGTAATFGFGFALPAVALRKAEARARSLFAAELSCAACLT